MPLFFLYLFSTQTLNYVELDTIISFTISGLLSFFLSFVFNICTMSANLPRNELLCLTLSRSIRKVSLLGNSKIR
jgi:hypothetical protein